MWEIFFICLGALVTVGLSINSVIQNGKKDIEIKAKTDSLIEAQKTIINKSNAINQKSDTIIKLQSELQKNAQIQIKSLRRINNPIPKQFTLTIFSNIETTDDELSLLSTASRINGNMLPIINQNSIERIDKLRNAQIILKLIFKKGTKSMEIIFSQTPMQLFGFNTVQIPNAFKLATAQNELQFNGINLFTENITTNYSSTSLLDFEKCDVTFEIDFRFAQRWGIGGLQADLYDAGLGPGLDVNLKSFSLSTLGRALTITDIQKISKNKFKGKWNG